ncbi:MAG: beta-glucosidase BglX [Parvularcula sp.]
MTKKDKKILVRMVCSVSFACVLVLGASGCKDQATTPENKTTLSPASAYPDSIEREAFLDELIEEMTLEEKLGQLSLLSAGWDNTGPTLRGSYEEEVRRGRAGAIFNAYTVEFTTKLQKIAVEETRLGIPLLFGYDVIHGHRTIFPISLGEAASWDLEAIEKSARIAAIEASAEGVHWTFAPMVDVARDPRWGRVSEGAGEDVYLGSRIAEARVHGFQGDDLGAPDTVLATAKHFAAYGAALAGRDYNTTDMSERELRETYLPPFKAAVDAGVATVMTAFNDLNGVPATANHFLLQDVLRGEWGFGGFVVADYTAVRELIPHGFARDGAQAAELALNAGVDMDMESGLYIDKLTEAVAEGRVSGETVDQAVRRILRMKYRLGLFEDPFRYSDAARQASRVMTAEHLEAARDVARKSMVLLKNQNGTLPLTDNVQSIALVGPLAASKSDLIGSWSAAGDRETAPVSVLEGLKQHTDGSIDIYYAKGASYEFGAMPEQAAIDEAVAAAAKADVIVAVVGEKWDMTGEAASRTSLTLPGSQQALLERLATLDKPLVLVLMNGRPLALEWADANADAIVEAWFPGTMGGLAVWDVLYGDYNPSGKLPMSFPRNVGQVPIYYNEKNTGRPYDEDNPEQKYLSRYLVTPNDPLYPFGYGLSYSSFEITDFRVNDMDADVDAPILVQNWPIIVEAKLSNSGPYDGAEIVQLYVQDVIGSATRPVKQLRGFQKISLAPGKSQTVRFEVSKNDLAFYRGDMSFGIEPGQYRFFIGRSSEDLLETEVEIGATAN